MNTLWKVRGETERLLLKEVHFDEILTWIREGKNTSISETNSRNTLETRFDYDLPFLDFSSSEPKFSCSSSPSLDQPSFWTTRPWIRAFNL